MPCSAKLPLIALITSSFFNNSVWIAPFVYIISVLSIFISGIILKKIKRFSGQPCPFIMEMPQYRLPKISVIYKTVKERILSFIKKAGTVIVLASIGVWILSNYGLSGTQIIKCEIKESFLAVLGKSFGTYICPAWLEQLGACCIGFVGNNCKGKHCKLTQHSARQCQYQHGYA